MIARSLLQAVLAVLALYHLAIGFVSVFSFAATSRAVSALYGIRLEAGEQMLHAVRMLGLYALAFGTLLTLAALSPESNRGIIGVAAGLQLARATARLFMRREVMAAFQLSGRGNAIPIVVLVSEAAVLLLGLALLD